LLLEMWIKIVPERKWPFLPISTSNQNFNPRNTQCMPVVKILIFPDIDSDLDKKFSFSFGHKIINEEITEKLIL
jgi:hypothetical protein